MELLNTKIRVVKGHPVFGGAGNILEVENGILVDEEGSTWSNLFRDFQELREYFLSNDLYFAEFEEVLDDSKTNIINFTKDDFKDGMIVEICDHTGKSDKFLYLGGMLLNQSGGGHALSSYNDDLVMHSFDYVITKVFKPNKPISMLVIFNDLYLDLIWEMKKPRKMTLAEIEKELGYEIEIERESDRKVIKEDDYDYF